MSDQQSAISYQLNKLSAISGQLEPCPQGLRNTKGNGSTDLRCEVFSGPRMAQTRAPQGFGRAPRRGEAGYSRTHLTCVRAAERRPTAGGAGVPPRDNSAARGGGD